MVSDTSPTSSHIRVAHELGVKHFEGRFWPEVRDRRDSPKLPISDDSKPVSDCFREHERNGAPGHEQTAAVHIRTTASG